MKSFYEFLNLFEAEPPMPTGGGGPPMGMDSGPPMGSPPMGGMGGIGGGMGGPPMGGMGGIGGGMGGAGGQAPQKPPVELKTSDVWEVLDKVLNKSGNENPKEVQSPSPDMQDGQGFQIPPNQPPQFLQSIPGVNN